MIYPLKFKPFFKQRIWGGEMLGSKMGKKLPAGVPVGESWEISGVEGDVSVVAEGKLRNNTLEELIEVFMGELVGEGVYEKYGLEFPVLIKLIDARDVLSIQVHPHDELARERHGCSGKTEMWYVIDCEPGAELYLGLRPGTTREEYLTAVESGTLPALLNRVKVAPGDAYFIPAGTLHAIGRGLLLAEIQQTSDVTYRVDDWGRVDEKGHPRELHTALALDAIDFAAPGEYDVTQNPVAGQAVTLKKCPWFTVNLVAVEGSLVRDYHRLDSFVAYVVLEGTFSVVYSAGEVTAGKGESVLVPAIEDEIELRGAGKLLEVYME